MPWRARRVFRTLPNKSAATMFPVVAINAYEIRACLRSLRGCTFNHRRNCGMRFASDGEHPCG